MGRELGRDSNLLVNFISDASASGSKYFKVLHRFRLRALALLAFQIFVTGATLGATHIQQASSSNVGGATFTSMSATFSLPTTNGNAIILGVTYGNVDPTITATDSQGNIYLQAVKTYDSGHRQGSAILYALNITGGASNKVTVQFSSAVAYLAVGVHEYSGILASSALDATVGKLGIGNAPSSGLATTTASGDLIFGCGIEDSTGSGATFTGGVGLAKRVDLGIAAAYADEDGVQALAGPFAATWTLSPASSWIATLAAFKTTTSSQNTTTPTITSLSPASGPVGTTVTITGTNFGQTQGTSIVSFNGLPATANGWSATAVAATVPSGATTGNVNITVNGVPSNSIQFSVAQISVAVSPASSTVQVGQSQLFTASLQNDTQNRGVTWSIVGSGCVAPSCGTLTNVTATSATYTAPASVPSSATVTIRAASVSDSTKSNAASVTITSAPLAIAVSVSPATTSVQVSTTANFTASVQNDSLNKGVAWSVSGAGCSGATCGTLTNVTATSITYTAPASVPSSAAVTITASSVSDPTKSNAANVTITAAPLAIAVSVSPATAFVQVSTAKSFTASVQNDSQNKGVTWSLSGGGCFGSKCGTLTNVTATSATYIAPARVPSPATVTIRATSVADATKSNAASVTITSAPLAIAVFVSPATASVQVSTATNFTASMQNDSQNQGVTWSVSGAGCSASTCGTLTNATATSVTYTAPATVPSPANISLQATSAADPTKSASSSITVAAVPAISVSVAPTSASVQISAAAAFTASVPNDSQNLGVIWSLSGVSCSGASCGALSNQTQTSVTYTAPATVPSTPIVTLTATSNSDNSKSAFASITITQPTQSNGVPTFAENHVSGSSSQGNPVSSYILRLPNPSMAGNCIIVGFQYSDTSGVTPSVKDDQGNLYSTPVQTSDGRQVVNLSYALNVAPGAQKITITFSGTSPAYVSAMASEFYNVAPSSALDGHTGSSGSGSTVSAGSFTPVTSGDLIYQYAIQDSTSASPMSSWTQGPNPWLLLSADLFDGAAAQYQVQASAAAIAPTLSMAPAQGFTSVAIALRPASAGTPPPSGIRVVRVQHNSVQPYASSPLRLQFPSTGNLLVISWIGVPGHDLTGVTDGNNNAYLSTGPAFGYGLSGDSQIYYAAGAATRTTLTGPNLSTSGTDISGSTAVLFDVRGAASAPYDNTAGRATAFGSLTTSGSFAAANLSPTTTNGLVISSIGIDSNTLVGVSPGNFLSSVPSPVSSPNPVNQNNGWALFYNTSPGPCTFVWTPQGGPVDDWASIAVAFVAAPN